MYENSTDFDSLLQNILGGAPEVTTSAPTKSASVVDNSDDSNLEQMVKVASAQLTQQELDMVDALAYMEAANTVKQANFIKETVGGELGMNFEYLAQKEAAMGYGSGSAELVRNFDKTTGGILHGINETVQEVTRNNPANQVIMGKGPGIHGAAKRVAKALKGDVAGEYIAGALYNKSIANRAGKLKETRSRASEDKLFKELMHGRNRTAKAVENVVGYGAPLAAAGVLAAGAYGVHKHRAAAVAAHKAKIEQQLGRKIVNHLGAHAGKYGLGALIAAGVLGGAATYQHRKQGSAEDYYEDELMVKAASVGEDFLDTLSKSAFTEAYTEELYRFREAAIAARASQGY